MIKMFSGDEHCNPWCVVLAKIANAKIRQKGREGRGSKKGDEKAIREPKLNLSFARSEIQFGPHAL